jgi:hypothetical protein
MKYYTVYTFLLLIVPMRQVFRIRLTRWITYATISATLTLTDSTRGTLSLIRYLIIVPESSLECQIRF